MRVPSRPVLRLAVNRRLVDGAAGVAYLARRSSMAELLPTERSAAYLDGFPRSANSYAFYAFRQANPDLAVTGHCHSAAAVRSALGHGVPVMVLLRDPEPCVASFVQYVPGLSVAAALRHYRRFHRRLVDVRGDLFVAPFADVVADFGSVVEAFNRHAGTTFAPYEKTATNEAAVAATLDHANEVYGAGTRTLARPTTARRAEGTLPIGSRAEQRLLDDCRRLHEQLLP